MSIVESPGRFGPVGHQGARVEIAERRAFAVNGWLGVLVLAACTYGAYLASGHDPGVTIAMAAIWLRERPDRWQVVGLAVSAVAVTAIVTTT